MDVPLARLRFRFDRLGSTRTRVVFFAMNTPVRNKAEVCIFNENRSNLHLITLFALTSTFGGIDGYRKSCSSAAGGSDEMWPVIGVCRNVGLTREEQPGLFPRLKELCVSSRVS
jgi:hypothetical protein